MYKQYILETATSTWVFDYHSVNFFGTCILVSIAYFSWNLDKIFYNWKSYGANFSTQNC